VGLLDRLRKKPARATIEPGGQTIAVAAGQKLLGAALEAGLDWPHDCRVGSCGTCRCRLRAGKIKPLSDFIYTLDARDIENGMILACQSLLKSDVVVEVALGQRTNVAIERYAATIARVTDLTHDIVEVAVRVGEPCFLQALAGQYVELKIAGVALPRCYSFARPPACENAGEVSFFIRHVPGGEFTDWLFAEPRTGAAIGISGPYGNFYQRDGDGPMICVAGGSGLAPIRALIEDGAQAGLQRDLHVYFGARTQADLYAMEEIEQLGSTWGGQFSLTAVLSAEPADSGWTGARGLVIEALAQFGAQASGAQAYLCGPPAMVDAALPVLAQLGIADSAIFYDKFEDASTQPRTES
jgi:CDP-4-dehydro-6-deoxyglucose reductase